MAWRLADEVMAVFSVTTNHTWPGEIEWVKFRSLKPVNFQCRQSANVPRAAGLGWVGPAQAGEPGGGTHHEPVNDDIEG